MAFFHLDIKQPFHAITAALNTHTIDLNKKGNNYSISANNATNTIIPLSAVSVLFIITVSPS